MVTQAGKFSSFSGERSRSPCSLNLKGIGLLPMDLNQQIQVLIDNAPQDETTPKVVRAIAPVLKQIAQQLRHSQYYILQTLNSDWVLTVLSNRGNPLLEKRVLYAFPTHEDALAAPSSMPQAQAIALPIPVTHILFQLMAMEAISSIVFFEQPGNRSAATEVRREDLQALIQLHLQQNQSQQRRKRSNLPPDIA
jgi:hypothetical protein